MSLVDGKGFPIGQAGASKIPVTDAQGFDPDEIARVLRVIIQKQMSEDDHPAIPRKVEVPTAKVELALGFWKPRYFDILVEDRHLNGIEAYNLGDPEKTPAAKVNKVPYIAMCNLMALEAIRMMGEHMPTSEEAVLLAYATEREKEIAKFWKDNFAPTTFQVEWAWKAALAVMSGDPGATSELLDNYKVQLPE